VDLGTAVSTLLPSLLAAAAALAVIVLGVVVALLARARKSAGAGDWTASPATVVDFSNDPGALAMTASFERAVRLLGEMPGGSRYALPWYLMIGGSAPANADLLASLSLVLPFGQPDPGTAPVSWWIYESAVVLEAAAAADASSVGGAGDPAAWQHLLHGLRETRPARPLDGLVVVLPAADLTDGSLPGGAAALAERAAFLGDRVTQLVAQLGFRLPVDVLVSGCNELPGFGRFVASVPPGQWQGIFGWANPNPLTAAYTPDWAAQAMTAVVRGVDRQELAFFGTPPGTGDAAAQLFPFARAVRGLTEPATAYLNHLFTLSAAAEPCFFRSLSFCGAPAEAGEESAGDGGRTAFVDDLFAQKVFPERALARPASNAASGREKALHALQALLAAAALAMVLGLWLGPGDVAGKIAPLLPWLDQVAARLPSGTTPQAGDGNLLGAMNGIPGYGVKSWGLPASWLSGANRRVRGALTVAATRIFLPAERGGLLGRRTALVAGRTPRPRPPQPPNGLPDSTPEFANLNDFGRALDALEGQVGGYDGFAAGASSDERKPASRLATFESLASYALGVELAPPTAAAARSLGDALAAVELPAAAKLPLAPDAEVQGRAQDLVARFYDAAFHKTYVHLDVDRLVQHLTALGQQSPAGATSAELRQLLAEINQTQQDLTRSDQAWIAGSAFPSSPAYQGMLAELQSSAWLGTGYSQGVKAAGAAGFQQMQKELAAASSPYTGAILAQPNGKLQLQLSAGVVALQNAIQGLFGQPFVPQNQPQPWQASVPPGQYLMWNAGVLSTAPPLIQSYQTFLTNGILLFPASLRQQVADVARQQLSVQVGNLLASAQSFVPASPPLNPDLLETQVQQQVQNFTAASTPLGQILTSSRQLNLSYGYPSLAQLLGAQAVGILREVRTLLAEARLYIPQDRDFSTWNGVQPPAPAAFGVASADGLKNYLSAQRSRASALNASYAQPVMATLDTVKSFDPQIVRHPVVADWNRIATVLAQYGQQTAGNSLADLEAFITTPMSQMTVATCRGKLGGGAPARGDDFFLAHQEQLATALGQRCDVLLIQDGRAGYCRLAADFGRELAGQYPFAAKDPGEFGPTAQPAAIARFFGVYDRYYKVIDQVPIGDLGEGGADIKAFMGQLAQVRALFASFLKQPDSPPTWNFSITFRTNRGQEVGGNQILTWTIQSGDQQISVTNPFQSATPPAAPPAASSSSSSSASGSPPASPAPSTPDSAATSTGQWSFGLPASVIFGWAQNSPWQPRPTGQQPHVAVSGGSVAYQYVNAWSILSLLRDRAATPPGPPQTLQFAIATQPVLQGAVAQAGSTIVFLRLQLQSPDDKKALTLPATFPAKAPPLALCSQLAPKQTAAR
jgi:type VI secretion system protein ImpL